jgi:hypothetical protein
MEKAERKKISLWHNPPEDRSTYSPARPFSSSNCGSGARFLGSSQMTEEHPLGGESVHIAWVYFFNCTLRNFRPHTNRYGKLALK